MGKFYLTDKKAQVWSLDVVVAGVIFSTGIIVLFFYAINYNNQAGNNLEDIFYDGNVAAEIILGEGEFGIISDNVINQTKVDEFSVLNYQSVKSGVGIKHNFYFTFPGLNVGGNQVSYLGLLNSSSVKDSVKITRFTVYENKPVKFELFVWR